MRMENWHMYKKKDSIYAQCQNELAIDQKCKLIESRYNTYKYGEDIPRVHGKEMAIVPYMYHTTDMIITTLMLCIGVAKIYTMNWRGPFFGFRARQWMGVKLLSSSMIVSYI